MTAAAPGFLGVLMLDTRFPRPPGDVGNPQTYARAGIPVRFLTVEGASPRRIVEEADTGNPVGQEVDGQHDVAERDSQDGLLRWRHSVVAEKRPDQPTVDRRARSER